MPNLKYEAPVRAIVRLNGVPKMAALQLGRDVETGEPIRLAVTVGGEIVSITLDDIERVAYEGG